MVEISKRGIRRLFAKGCVEALLFIHERGDVRFSEVSRFCLDNRIVKGRGTVTTLMRSLTDMGLLERRVVATRPIQTSYRLTELGVKIAEHLKVIKQLLEARTDQPIT